MKDWTPKDFGKAAFAVGVGFTIGKEFGETIKQVIDACSIITLKYIAGRGNNTIQQRLTKANGEWETKSEEPKNKMKMGFEV